MKAPIQKVRGAILVMAALILVILIGIAAFALDIGRLFVLQTEMQNAVDAAVLSATVELDGEAGALDRAKTAANQEMLNHLAHFSRKNELLKNLETEVGAFTFYTWIGSNADSAVPPSDCSLIEGKCQTTSDADATYVQIELDPALLGDDDGRYEIDLYFLPILSLFGEKTATAASTRVAALAGSHYSVCNYPPIIICDPSEGGPALNPGEMVKLKEHQANEQWGPGTFGWLIPTKVDKDPDDDNLTSNKLLAHRLGSIYGQECAPPIVEVNPGNKGNWPRRGLNTRFGIYDHMDENKNFPSAPNVIDYPRDDNLTLKTGGECEGDDSVRFGSGIWNVTECHSNPNLPQQPSTYSKANYNSTFHDPGVPAMETRNEYYAWELSAINNLPVSTIALTDLHGDETQCADNGTGAGNNSNCRMLDGKPFITANFVDVTDEHKRRELFVAAVACQANEVKSNSVLNMNEIDGKWMKFFMTEHVDHPGGSEKVNVYAEFIEEVDQTDDEHFKRVIQLYE